MRGLLMAAAAACLSASGAVAAPGCEAAPGSAMPADALGAVCALYADHLALTHPDLMAAPPVLVVESIGTPGLRAHLRGADGRRGESLGRAVLDRPALPTDWTLLFDRLLAASSAPVTED